MKENALRWLEQAYLNPYSPLIWLKVDPWFDRLRGGTNSLHCLGASRLKEVRPEAHGAAAHLVDCVSL